MNRISMIKQYVDKIIEDIPSIEERKKAYIHTYGVAQCCSIIAGKRGLNPEIAYISGLLHDIYAYYAEDCLCHAQSGADMARAAIRNMNIFSDDEKIIILSAIFYHSNKELIHDEYDEVLKDADILQRYLNESCSSVIHLAVPRLNNVLNEFKINTTPIEYGQEEERIAKKHLKSRYLLIVQKNLQ